MKLALSQPICCTIFVSFNGDDFHKICYSFSKNYYFIFYGNVSLKFSKAHYSQRQHRKLKKLNLFLVGILGVFL